MKIKKLSLFLGIVTLALVLKPPLFISSLANKISIFSMLETIAIIDNFMTPIDSPLLADTSSIQGAISTTENNLANLKNPKLNKWIEISQTKALIIWKDGEILHESYEAGCEHGSKINGLSMAKTITAILIGIAIDEGRIPSENESILTFLPELKFKHDNKVSIKNLLQQESGMHDSFPNVLKTLQGNTLESELAKLNFKEDKTFQYSNVNYHLLSLILKRVYQKELNEIISEKLWIPLNLNKAQVINSTGYCCIFASARSWLAIGELILNDGLFKNGQEEKRIVSKAWLDKMRNDTVEPEWFIVQLSSKGKKNTYAYHIFSGLEEYPNLYWSEGMGLQLILIDPINKMIVVRLGDIPTAFKNNTNRWDKNLGQDLLEVISNLP